MKSKATMLAVMFLYMSGILFSEIDPVVFVRGTNLTSSAVLRQVEEQLEIRIILDAQDQYAYSKSYDHFVRLSSILDAVVEYFQKYNNVDLEIDRGRRNRIWIHPKIRREMVAEGRLEPYDKNDEIAVNRNRIETYEMDRPTLDAVDLFDDAMTGSLAPSQEPNNSSDKSMNTKISEEPMLMPLVPEIERPSLSYDALIINNQADSEIEALVDLNDDMNQENVLQVEILGAFTPSTAYRYPNLLGDEFQEVLSSKDSTSLDSQRSRATNPENPSKMRWSGENGPSSMIWSPLMASMLSPPRPWSEQDEEVEWELSSTLAHQKDSFDRKVTDLNFIGLTLAHHQKIADDHWLETGLVVGDVHGYVQNGLTKKEVSGLRLMGLELTYRSFKIFEKNDLKVQGSFKVRIPVMDDDHPLVGHRGQWQLFGVLEKEMNATQGYEVMLGFQNAPDNDYLNAKGKGVVGSFGANYRFVQNNQRWSVGFSWMRNPVEGLSIEDPLNFNVTWQSVKRDLPLGVGLYVGASEGTRGFGLTVNWKGSKQ